MPLAPIAVGRADPALIRAKLSPSGHPVAISNHFQVIRMFSSVSRRTVFRLLPCPRHRSPPHAATPAMQKAAETPAKPAEPAPAHAAAAELR
jgi:hypothetical protein